MGKQKTERQKERLKHQREKRKQDRVENSSEQKKGKLIQLATMWSSSVHTS